MASETEVSTVLTDAPPEREILTWAGFGEATRELAQEIADSGFEPDIVLDALYGPLYHRLLLPYDGDAVHLSDAYIDALIDTVFGGFERK